MLKSQTGSATIFGIIVLVIFGIMSAGLMPWMTNETKSAVKNRNLLAAQYAAEAGVKRTLTNFTPLTPNWDWLNSNQNLITDSPNENEQYNVLIYVKGNANKTSVTPTLPNTYIVESRGTVNGSVKTVSVEITVTGGGGGNPPVNPLKAGDAAVYAGDSLEFKNNGTINGASIASGGTITNGNNLHIANPYIKQANTPLDFPQYSVDSFKDSPALPSPTNNQVVLTDGQYYINGNWSINQNSTISGNGTIFVNGHMVLPQNANFTGNVTIITKGNIDGSNSNNISFNKVVLVAYGDITVKNNFNATGAVMATGSISFKNNMNVTYDGALVNSSGVSTTNGKGKASVKTGTWKIN